MHLVFVFQEEKRVYLKEIILQIAANCEDEIANKIGVDLSVADFIISCSISLRLRDEGEADGGGETNNSLRVFLSTKPGKCSVLNRTAFAFQLKPWYGRDMVPPYPLLKHILYQFILLSPFSQRRLCVRALFSFIT